MIYWLASYPKSGNTWARLLWSAYRNNGDADINGGITAGDLNTAAYQGASVLPLSRFNARSIVFLRYAALINLIAMRPDKPLVVKTHMANAEDCGVRFIPPRLTARAVYLVRDPRDVAPSFARHVGKTLDEVIELMRNPSANLQHKDNLTHFISSWSNHVQSWGSKEIETTLVKYEDMRKSPHDALERMLLTFNVEPNAERIHSAVSACELSKLQSQECTSGFAEASDKAGPFFGATNEVLSNSQRREVENDHGEMMEALEY